MRLSLLAGLLATFLIGAVGHTAQAMPSSAYADTTDYRVYTATGEPASLDAIEAAFDTVEVVLLGEIHGHAPIHALQDSLWQRLLTHERPATLSLEMFERDVQPVLDEYLAGLIPEDHFLQASRPWPSYERDYHALVDSARTHNAPVLAANAPRRYVNRVAREGRAALDDLPASALHWLPPLPYPEASEAYRERFLAQMHGGAHPTNHAPSDTTDTDETASPHEYDSGMAHLLDAQMLWDATMAYTIAEHLLHTPEAVVMHLTGRFHIAERTGTPETLAHYRPGTPQLVVYFDAVADPSTFDDDAHTGQGDFVVLTAE